MESQQNFPRACSGWSGAQFFHNIILSSFSYFSLEDITPVVTDMHVREQPGDGLSCSPVNRNWYCKLMLLLRVQASAASKVDAATQTEARDDNMKTEMISTEPIVSSGRSQ